MGMRRSHKVMAALAVASGALVACNLLTGLDADYSASGHDGAVGPVGEGGGGDGDPGSDGAAMEGSTTDGMVKPDGDAGLTAWCRAMQDGAVDDDFFCTDFEGASFPDGGNAPAGWSGITNDRDAGTLTFVEVDASRALDVTSASNGAAGAHTRLLKILATTDPHKYLHYELQYDFCVLSSTLQYGAVGLLTFAPFSVAAKEHGIATYGPGTPATLSQQGGTGALVKELANDGKWHHATITLDRAPADMTYARTIFIDTMSVDGNGTGHMIASGDPTEVSIGVFNAATNVGNAHIQFDNIVFRRKQ